MLLLLLLLLRPAVSPNPNDPSAHTQHFKLRCTHPTCSSCACCSSSATASLPLSIDTAVLCTSAALRWTLWKLASAAWNSRESFWWTALVCCLG